MQQLLALALFSFIVFHPIACHSRSDNVETTALILELKWAAYRDLPQYNVEEDPLRRNLKHELPHFPPSSCHYYLVDKSCNKGPMEQSVVCVQCSTALLQFNLTTRLQRPLGSHWPP